MNRHPNLLSTTDEMIELAKTLKRHKIIAFDTEFIRESTFFPIVEIIQIATDSESWLVDAQAFIKDQQQSKMNPLLEIFVDPDILKVVHAAQGDQECLFTSFEAVASPTLDTAVAASLCGYGDGVGLGKLLKMVLDVNVTKGHARTNWSVRPLPEQLIAYAHADVEYLVELGKNLISQLDALGRKDWALELSAKWEDKSLYQIDVEGLTQKLARNGRLDKQGYMALSGLIQWREERVRHLNLPRRWVADDHVLLDLAHVRPKDLAHLGTFRGLNKGELKNSGEAILAALHHHSELDNVILPKMPKSSVPTLEESQILDLLRCYVGILADQHKIASKHLMSTSKLLPLLRSKIENSEELGKAGILSEAAARLIGEELIAMIRGKRALIVDQSQIKVMKINN